MIKKSFYLTVFVVFLFSSCTSYKNIPYFKNLDAPANEQIRNYSPLTIQPEDILGINVSSLNPEASSVFNYNLTPIEGTYVNADNPVMGYLVDYKGEIHVPLIGAMKVSGLTTSELRVQMKDKLLKYLKEPVVNIRILNFKVSVLGDVGRPGIYTVQNERLTLPEALTLAGDLNITARRYDVLLIREREGKREYININLNSKDLFNSPYYYLKNNDLLYIQPDRTKFAAVDQGYRNISLLLSALSIAAIIFTRYN